MNDILLLLDLNGYVVFKVNNKYFDINNNVIDFHNTTKSFNPLMDITKTILKLTDKNFVCVGEYQISIDGDIVMLDNPSNNDNEDLILSANILNHIIEELYKIGLSLRNSHD